MKAYFQSRTVPGYGRRIYIPYAHTLPAVVKRMNFLSCWDGADKDTGMCKSWEFGTYSDTSRFEEAKSYLVGYGFTLEECGEVNAKQVWK